MIVSMHTYLDMLEGELTLRIFWKILFVWGGRAIQVEEADRKANGHQNHTHPYYWPNE